jgi:glycosyltransferase involved in cell wall biosynthesis
MRVLQVHNFYQQAGGEDRVVAAEQELLSSNGHEVFQYTVSNESVNKLPVIELGIKTIWNGATYRCVRRLIAEQAIDILHLHNTLPLISPSVYYAAKAARVPVVQTLHNYRLQCPAATFYRQGEICELCLNKTVKYPAVLHSCYRGSRAASAAVCAMLAAHGFAGTFRQNIHTYIALTEFAKKKYAEGGLPAGKIVVKPNFLQHDPGAGSGRGGYALFAGRLTAEKGLAALLDAWSACPHAIPLKIAGDGPLRVLVESRAAALPNVEYLGLCEHSRLLALLKDAVFLTIPSRWYEGMPMVLVESMACGTPVVGFAVGSLDELIIDGENGVKLTLDGKDHLSDFLKDSRRVAETMGRLRAGARAYFERHFTARLNYQLLNAIYQRVLGPIGYANVETTDLGLNDECRRG